MKPSPDGNENAVEIRKSGLKVGWCRVDDLKRYSYLHPHFDRGLPTAISMALPLGDEIIDSIDELPNLIYQRHYRTVNHRLEAEALELAGAIQSGGYRALPVPVTISVDPYNGHLSHRMAGMLSGLGWIGKSSLLVTPENCARVRLVTVLTDLPLPGVPEPMPNRCGECRHCIEICPVGAIGEDPRDINRELCYNYLKSLIRRGIVEELICGLCIKVCDGGGIK